MNPKIVKLLHEGFSINTLENLNENQLNMLYKKITEQEQVINVKKGSPDEANTTTTKNYGVGIIC
jgi:hypothetical protein